jgi:TonB-dependent starch-binding outer membrane protein SusC
VLMCSKKGVEKQTNNVLNLITRMMKSLQKTIGLLLLLLGINGLTATMAQSSLAQIDKPVFLQKERDTGLPLKRVLADLTVKHGATFHYNSRIVDDKFVHDVPNNDLAKSLETIQLQTQLTIERVATNQYMILASEKRSEGPLSITPVLTPNQSKINQFTVTGKVTDAADGAALVGVTVVQKGTTNGTVTDIDGLYSLSLPTGNELLVFSSIGYLPKVTSAGNQKVLNMVLESDNKLLGEQVVIGYGTRKRDELSGAVTTISSELITKQNITSFDQALAGQVAGLTLREGSGAPGGGPEILIRGINTFGSNKPLIVIDDVIFESYNDQNNNPLSLLNPEDIESMTVLKDAATKAIYGSRATAGVIMVTTKRGKLGKPTFTFNTNTGFSTAMEFENPNMMNARELAQFRKESTIDKLRYTNPTYKDPSVPVPDNLIPAAFLNPEQYGEGTNWFDEITRTAVSQTSNISVNGGTENVKYFVSANYLNQEGVILKTDLQRLALRANLDIKLSPKFKLGVDLSPSRTMANRPATDPASGGFSAYSTVTATYWISPEAKVRDANGNFNYLTTSPLTTSWTSNPVYELYAEKEERLANQLNIGSYLEFEPLPNLSFKTKLSYTNNIRRSRAFSPSTIAQDGLNPVLPRPDGARAQLYNENFSNILSDNIVRYRLIKNKHNLELFGAFTAQDVTTESSTLNAKRLLDENLTLVSFSNVDKTAVDNFSGSEGFTQNRLLSGIGRINYIFDKKYLFNFSVRQDGSSRFGRTVQSAIFPAGSFAWRASDENFIKKHTSKWLDELRFEVGYGITGNQQGIGNYSFLGTVTQQNYIFGGVSTLGNTLTSTPNSEITWEQSKQLDIGFNLAMFKKRVSLAFNVYQQTTDGLLSFIPIPAVTGFTGVQGNGGTVENKGFEIQLDVNPIKKRNFDWTSSFNCSAYRNNIVKLTNGTFYSGTAGNGSAITISKEGEPVGMYFGLKTLGLFTEADMADSKVPKYAGAAVGTHKYLDGNGNGVLEQQADHVITGNPHPDLLFGWTNQLRAHGFNLRIIMQGQLGGTIMDLRREVMYNVDGNFNISRDMFDRFRPGDDPTTKTIPTTAAATAQFRWPSDNKLTDGSFVALKNITLGYDLMKLFTKRKVFLRTAEIYTSVRNAFYLANYTQGNPEIRRSNDGSAVRSVNYGSYPISRTTTVGVNITF